MVLETPSASGAWHREHTQSHTGSQPRPG